MARRAVSSRRLTALISSLIFLDMLTWLAAIPLIPYWQRELGLSDDQAGIVLGIYSLTVLLASIPSGHLADRIGPRRLTLIGAALFVIAAPSIAFAGSFGLLLAARVFQGACSTITWTAGLAWLAGAVAPEQRIRSLSVANATATVGTIAGPLFGGPLVVLLGIEAAFVGLGALVLAVIGWALIEPGGVARHVQEEGRQGAFTPLRAARRPGLLQMSFLAIGFVSLMMAALQLLAPLYFDGEGLGTAAIGWIFTAGSALSVLAILIVGRLGRRLDIGRVLVVLTPLCGLLTVALLVPLGVPWYAGGLIAVIALSAPIFTLAYGICADGAREAGIGEGSAFGMLNAVWATGAVISPVVSGIVAQGNVSWVVYVFVAVLSAVAAVLIGRSRHALPAAG